MVGLFDSTPPLLDVLIALKTSEREMSLSIMVSRFHSAPGVYPLASSVAKKGELAMDSSILARHFQPPSFVTKYDVA